MSLPYQQIPETRCELDWADLVVLDLSRFDQPGGKEALSKQLFETIKTTGLFYITNFGLSQEQIARQYAICGDFFQLSTEEKLKYRTESDRGFMGYRGQGHTRIRHGGTEMYNMPKFIPDLERAHPGIINDNRTEIEKFARHVHDGILSKLLVLFATALGLPEEDFFLRSHRYSKKSDCHLRYMKYQGQTPEENQSLSNVWVDGHTDPGTLTLLFRQPVAALQVLTPGPGGEGTWKWVRPLPDTLLVNVADALEFVTKGFMKSCVHRVAAPPPDQTCIDRLGVLYFVCPEDDTDLRPIESGVLGQLSYNNKTADSSDVCTVSEWIRARLWRNRGVKENQATSAITV